MRAGASTGRASAAAMATTAAAGIPGTITFDGFVTINSGGDPKTFTFDASGSDKLVVVVTGEHNFGGNTSGDMVSITYDGVSLTKAVEQAPVSSTLQTTSDLWYLDNPGSVHTAGQIVVDMIGNGNNFVHTAIGLSGTAPGFAGASSIAIGTPTVNMNVSAPNSMVIHWLTLGGSGNTAGSAYTVTANSPAGAITFGGSEAGSNYAGHALARSSGLPVGTNTFSFNTGLTDVLCLAAEFLAADIPATAYQIWSSQYPGADLTDPAADFDGGGLPTGIEWVRRRRSDPGRRRRRPGAGHRHHQRSGRQTPLHLPPQRCRHLRSQHHHRGGIRRRSIRLDHRRAPGNRRQGHHHQRGARRPRLHHGHRGHSARPRIRRQALRPPQGRGGGILVQAALLNPHQAG